MSDPTDQAIARASARGPELQGERREDNHVLRRPGKRAERLDDDTRLNIKGDEHDLPDELRNVDLSQLDEDQRTELLRSLVIRTNTISDARRAVQLKDDELDLENKRRFSDLGLKLAKGTGIFVLLALTALISLLGYAIVYDKSMIDGSIIGAFLSTFAEVFKTIFSVF